VEPVKFSAAWWSDQARAAGALTKAAIEALTGQTFDTIPQPGTDPLARTVLPWYVRVTNEAPGFKASPLVLTTVGNATYAITDENWDPSAPGFRAYPDNVVFRSPVGYVAPGTTTPYNPTLSTTAPDPVNLAELDPLVRPPGANDDVPTAEYYPVQDPGVLNPSGPAQSGDGGIVTQAGTGAGVGTQAPLNAGGFVPQLNANMPGSGSASGASSSSGSATSKVGSALLAILAGLAVLYLGTRED
jgi:hypothetical protein